MLAHTHSDLESALNSMYVRKRWVFNFYEMAWNYKYIHTYIFLNLLSPTYMASWKFSTTKILMLYSKSLFLVYIHSTSKCIQYINTNLSTLVTILVKEGPDCYPLMVDHLVYHPIAKYVCIRIWIFTYTYIYTCINIICVYEQFLWQLF